MTSQEAERMLRQELQAAIANAQANGLDGDIIAHDLRSTASDVSKQWNAELDRRNAQYIEEQKKQTRSPW